MKRCFSGFENLLLIFSLSMVCLVSPAKGMPHYKTIFNKNILFLSSEHELKSNISSPDRVVNTAYLKVRQVYCNFLLKVFEKSEVNFSLVFIILIYVWSYHRYEIIKIKKRNSIKSKSIKPDTDQIPDTFEINHYDRKEGSLYVAVITDSGCLLRVLSRTPAINKVIFLTSVADLNLYNIAYFF